MLTIQVAKVTFETDHLVDETQSHLFRGFVTNQYKEYELVHNHDERGKSKYRYPMIQYKIIENQPSVIAIGKEAISIAEKMFCQFRQIRIKRAKFRIKKSHFNVKEYSFGIAPKMHLYQWVSPWIGLNSKNFAKYNESEETQRFELLRKCLTGNLLSVSKYLDYRVPANIQVKPNLQSKEVILKGKKMLGFLGYFSTNFSLPDYIGLGKSPSRGYGCFKDITEQIQQIL